MDRATQLALNAINRRFYASITREWIDSRKTPWPGFERIVSKLPDGPLRVLDLGCGDGRFGQYLSERRSELDYLGCDASQALLQHATQRQLGARYRFVETDFITTEPAQALPPGSFDLICVLGVLHHVPGRSERQALVRALAARLAPGGLLVLTLWRLDQDPRFSTRVVPFADYNRSAAEPLALDQLEPGDTLLRWGNPGGPPRYCHFPDALESAQLVAAPTLQLVERFHADGRGGKLNEYALLRA